MSDFIQSLEHDLVVAAAHLGEQPTRAGVPRVRPSLRAALVAAGVTVLVAGSAAGATLVALRGSVIPAPATRDAGPPQTPVLTSVHLTPARAADPGGGPPWALRLARSQTGFICSTVGQELGGRFGLIGLDGRFRSYADGVVDSCGQQLGNSVSLIGARVFEARTPGAVRTVINGVGGPHLRGVQIQSGTTITSVPVARDGVFLAAFRGYPEDAGYRVTLRFADGHREVRTFGLSPFVARNPSTDVGVWKSEAFGVANNPALCVLFRPARERRNPAISPAACGLPRQSPDPRRYPTGLFFAARRIEPTGAIRYTFARGRWLGHAPLTAVWGWAGANVRSVGVSVANGPTRSISRRRHQAFLAVFPASTDPHSLAVHVTFNDGTTRVLHGDTNLTTPPGS